MREVHVITNPSTVNAALETWFFQNILLQELPFGLEWEIEKVSNSVVIYLELTDINIDTINILKSNNNKVILCQMGDENMMKYHKEAYEACDFVLRNYYFKELFLNQDINQKLMWIPNGYRSGVGPRSSGRVRRSAKRHFLASFMGWLNNSASFGNERNLFAAVAKDCGSNLFLNQSDSFSRGYNVGLYSAVLEHSVFCPCPAGNSPETIRLYDALELGCIPISLKQDFLNIEYAIIDPPFPLLDTWSDLPKALQTFREQLDKDPKAIDRLQEACLEWWDHFKSSTTNKIAEVIRNLQQPSGPDLKTTGENMTTNLEHDVKLIADNRNSCSWVTGYYGVINVLANQCKAESLCEIGVAYGYHAEFLLNGLPSVSYVGIDPYMADYDSEDIHSACVAKLFGEQNPQAAMDRLHSVVASNLSRFGERAQLVRENSWDAAARFSDGHFGLIYIDGNHTYSAVKQDLEAWYPKVKAGGILCGDDITMPGVKQALEEFVKSRNVAYQLIGKKDTQVPIWWIQI